MSVKLTATIRKGVDPHVGHSLDCSFIVHDAPPSRMVRRNGPVFPLLVPETAHGSPSSHDAPDGWQDGSGSLLDGWSGYAWGQATCGLEAKRLLSIVEQYG